MSELKDRVGIGEYWSDLSYLDEMREVGQQIISLEDRKEALASILPVCAVGVLNAPITNQRSKRKEQLAWEGEGVGGRDRHMSMLLQAPTMIKIISRLQESAPGTTTRQYRGQDYCTL